MIITFRRTWLVVVALSLALAGRAAPNPAEDQKIEMLLAYVGEHTEVVFIRNGSEYQAATAVKFLHGKWDRARKDIGTAREFIDKVATKSSTSGKPYRIRFPGGREIDCAEFLTARLDEIEKPHASAE